MSVEEKSLIIFALLLGVGLLVLLFILFVSFYRVKKRMMLEGLDMQRIHQNELNSVMVEVQNQTLKSIGQELHDNLGQKLTLATLQVGSIDTDSNALAEKKKLLNETLQESIRDLRRLSESLDPNFIMDIGFYRCVQKEVERISKLEGLEVHFERIGEAYILSNEIELALFRIFQEGVNNCLKHSMATNLYIELVYKAQFFKMNIIDDGIGFDLEENSKSTGLRNIQSHTEYIDAKLLIESSMYIGTSLSIVLPI